MICKPETEYLLELEFMPAAVHGTFSGCVVAHVEIQTGGEELIDIEIYRMLPVALETSIISKGEKSG